MKNSLIRLFIVIMLTCFSQYGIAQSSVAPELIASGGGIESSNLQIVTYSIGEPIIGTIEEGPVILTQGFQQSDSNMPETGGPNDLQVLLYPNPASDKITLQFSGHSNQLILVVVVDLLGRSVLQEPITIASNQESIDISNISSGTYVVEVFLSDTPILTSKIIKQ